MHKQIHVNLAVENLPRAKPPRAPQDHGFMLAHGFEDLDGHIWELLRRVDVSQAGAD